MKLYLVNFESVEKLDTWKNIISNIVACQGVGVSNFPPISPALGFPQKFFIMQILCDTNHVIANLNTIYSIAPKFIAPTIMFTV